MADSPPGAPHGAPPGAPHGAPPGAPHGARVEPQALPRVALPASRQDGSGDSAPDAALAAPQILPRISPLWLALFRGHARRYVRRHFHHLRLSHDAASDAVRLADIDGPILVYLNHPSWWDPLTCLLLATHLFPQRRHYAPIEQAALERYQFFARLGMFGVDTGSRHGAMTFLTVGERILRQSDVVLWMTPQGRFADPRERPMRLQPGLGHLLRRAGRVTVLPLALEYPLWTERLPEALARLGPPLHIEHGGSHQPREWTLLLAERLQRTQDELAALAIRREAAAFRELLHGRAGVNWLYDAWRALHARLRGERFRREHVAEAETR